MTITTLSHALSAYGAALKQAQAGGAAAAPAAPAVSSAAPRFESLLRAEVDATRTSLRASEAKAVEALGGRACRRWSRRSPRPSSACRR
jgi:hypothetical protein